MKKDAGKIIDVLTLIVCLGGIAVGAYMFFIKHRISPEEFFLVAVFLGVGVVVQIVNLSKKAYIFDRSKRGILSKNEKLFLTTVAFIFALSLIVSIFVGHPPLILRILLILGGIFFICAPLFSFFNTNK